MSQFVPQPPLRDPTHDQLVERVLQGAVPDLEYTDPRDGKKKIVEVKFINQCPSSLRYGRVVATSLRASASVNKREQQLELHYQESDAESDPALSSA